MNTTKPAPPWTPALDQRRPEHARLMISPLARAALENGVAFDDVAAYAQAEARYTASVYEELVWELLADGGGDE